MLGITEAPSIFDKEEYAGYRVKPLVYQNFLKILIGQEQNMTLNIVL